MKKKKQKRRKRRRNARHEIRAAHAKRSKPAKNSHPMPPSTPWLRMISTSVEDESGGSDSRGLFAQRTGRRQSSETDLYVPAHDPRNR
jgi:hypothetical protein